MTKISNKIDGLSICAVVLAAGKGTRMQSDLPKVLHEIAGKPILQWILDTLYQLPMGGICVVLGGEMEQFSQLMTKNSDLRICRQWERRGTADAVAATYGCWESVQKPRFAKGSLEKGTPLKADYVLICLGDTPGLSSVTLSEFMKATVAQQAALAVLGMDHANPRGYGRLVRNAKGELEAIVEEKNANESERKISLCNTGVMMARADLLFRYLDEVTPNSVSGEYYLTDCFAVARRHGAKVYVHVAKDFHEFDGVNDREQFENMKQYLLRQRRV